MIGIHFTRISLLLRQHVCEQEARVVSVSLPEKMRNRMITVLYVEGSEDDAKNGGGGVHDYKCLVLAYEESFMR